MQKLKKLLTEGFELPASLQAVGWESCGLWIKSRLLILQFNTYVFEYYSFDSLIHLDCFQHDI